MRRLAIVQARFNALGRFPGKVLADIEGKPMLQRVVERVGESFTLDGLVVATPDRQIADLVETWGYPVFLGPEQDVLTRYYYTAICHRAETIIRITADCPLIDPSVIDQTMAALGYHDYASNVLDRTYPKGLDVEIFPMDTLDRLNRLAHTEAHREHVTLYIRDYAALFDTVDVRAPRDDSGLNVSVDTPEDLERVRYIYKTCGDESNYQKWLEAAYGYTPEPVATAS